MSGSVGPLASTSASARRHAGPGAPFSQAHKGAHSAVQEAAFGRHWAAQGARRPRVLASQLAVPHEASLVPKHLPLRSPHPSRCRLTSPGLEGPPFPSSWHRHQAGCHGTQAAWCASREPWPSLPVWSQASGRPPPPFSIAVGRSRRGEGTLHRRGVGQGCGWRRFQVSLWAGSGMVCEGQQWKEPWPPCRIRSALQTGSIWDSSHLLIYSANTDRASTVCAGSVLRCAASAPALGWLPGSGEKEK